MILTDQQKIELLEKWEPKVNSFLRTASINGYEREDIAQELRLAILKAANKFDESRGIKFHTYLHVVMLNTVRGLWAKAGKNIRNISIEYLREVNPENNNIDKIEDTSQTTLFDDVDTYDVLDKLNLTESELAFIDFRIQGYTLREISDLMKVNAEEIRRTLREKAEISL